jgi:transcription elongation factor Elf1
MLQSSRRASLDDRERAAARWRKWNEPRPWLLTCPSCEHIGTVHTTLKKLRAANLKCSACGAYLWRK